ncbi:hypothetical protein Ancab_018882 [Ancistrocladus abbreviatus]
MGFVRFLIASSDNEAKPLQKKPMVTVAASPGDCRQGWVLLFRMERRHLYVAHESGGQLPVSLAQTTGQAIGGETCMEIGLRDSFGQNRWPEHVLETGRDGSGPRAREREEKGQRSKHGAGQGKRPN